MAYPLGRHSLKDAVIKQVHLLHIGLLRGLSSLRSGCLLLRPYEVLLVPLTLLIQQRSDVGCVARVCIWCDIGRAYGCIWTPLLLQWLHAGLT